MKKGKLIVIEGTDCSGKETQSDLLIEKLRKKRINLHKFSFPNYNSPTGKIVGGPYLGKEYICKGWFDEGAVNVDAKVSSLYYAADRKYNIDKINWLLDNGMHVILDRYVYSNMAHQGSKFKTKEERLDMFKWIEKLEFELLELPRPDIAIFLHMPVEKVLILKKNRIESDDELECNVEHLTNAENTYIELANLFNFKTIECVNGDDIRTKEDISNEVYNFIIKEME